VAPSIAYVGVRGPQSDYGHGGPRVVGGSETWRCSDAVTRGRAIAFTRKMSGAMAGAAAVRILAIG
jgi:hypothetical protein